MAADSVSLPVQACKHRHNRCAVKLRRLAYNDTMSNSQNSLLPAYLIVGTDELKRRRALERLRKRVAEFGDLEFNHDLFDAENASGSDIASACNTLPFASELRLVEAKNLEALAKQDQEVLIAYLSAPSPSTVFAASSEKLAKNTRLYKAFAAIGKQAVIDCSQMKRFELLRALRSMAVDHGFTISEAGAAKLVELVGEDTIRLDTELRKIALSAKGNDIVSDRLIASLVARTTEAKPWELVNAMCERDLKQCLVLLGLVDASPIQLIAMCTGRLRELACAKALEARGEAGALASTLGYPAWRVKNHSRWARNFTEAEIKEAFSKARDCERALKSSSGGFAFQDWLVATVNGK